MYVGYEFYTRVTFEKSNFIYPLSFQLSVCGLPTPWRPRKFGDLAYSLASYKREVSQPTLIRLGVWK